MRWAIELATFETKSAVIVKIRSSNALLCIWLRKPNDDCTGSFRRDFVAGGTAATSIRALVNEPPLAGILEKLNGRSNLAALRAEWLKFMLWTLVSFHGVHNLQRDDEQRTPKSGARDTRR